MPANYAGSVLQADRAISLVLPNGANVRGRADEVRRDHGQVVLVHGGLTHPESGRIELADAAGRPQGTLVFDGQAREWRIVEDGGKYYWREFPAEDAFRPRAQAMPQRAGETAETRRARSEAEMRDALKVETQPDGTLKIGEVVVDPGQRQLRVRAEVNMTAGQVEYALVTKTGKCHESLFSTTASPRDIHLAMLLLGVKAGGQGALAATGGSVPPESAVSITVHWQSAPGSGPMPLRDMYLVMPVPTEAKRLGQQRLPWIYNGSRFTGGGFAAVVEGSIIALADDDLALLNNAAEDRRDDEAHVPNGNLLPKPGTAVEILFSPVSTTANLAAPTP